MLLKKACDYLYLFYNISTFDSLDLHFCASESFENQLDPNIRMEYDYRLEEVNVIP